MIFCSHDCFIREDYLQTSTGNIISRKAKIFKAQAVEIPQGKVIIKDDVVIRGDLSAVQINKYSIISSGTILRPSYGVISGSFRFIPLTIGSHCIIGKDCIIQAAVIGIGCNIGNNCILSKRCILKDFAYIEPNTVVPPDMVIPPFAIVGGNPGRIIGELSESVTTLALQEAEARYKSTTPHTATTT